MFAPFQITRKISSPAEKMTMFSLKGIARKVILQFGIMIGNALVVHACVYILLFCRFRCVLSRCLPLDTSSIS